MPIQALGHYSAEQIEAYYASGDWTEQNFTDLLRGAAQEHGDKGFLTDGTHALSYTEVYGLSQKLALGLHRKGLRSGDRVAVQLPNWVEFVAVAGALARIGAVLVPVMPIYRKDEVAHVVADASVTMAVTAAEFKGFDHVAMFEAIRENSSTLKQLVAVRADEGTRPAMSARGVDALESLIVEGIDEEGINSEIDHTTHPDSIFAIVYTSGTTSRPKGCVHTFNTYAAGARALREAFEMGPEDVQFGPSPIAHTTGLVTSVLVPLMAGAASHFMTEWDPERAVEEIERFGCTAAVTATTFLHALMAAAQARPETDLSSLRLWTCAGSPIPSAVVEQAAKVFPQTRVLSLYGRSENLTTTTCKVSDDPGRAITSDGAALPGAEVRVVDFGGEEAPRGEEGDIAYRGPSHMVEYLNQPHATTELFTEDGFSRSGDLGVMDEDGFVRVTGRLKDIVIRGGMNIGVRELEDKLAEHPDLAACAVVGMPDERLGEKVCCYLVPKSGHVAPDVAGIRTFLTDRGVAIQKTPEHVVALDHLPMTATGKIQKHLLRKRIAEEIERAKSTGAPLT